MAGSPGAGKTEFSTRFIENFEEAFKERIVRIDADEVRAIVPGFNGTNAHVIQRAAALGVEKIHDFSLQKKFHLILDATFADLEKAKMNINRSLRSKRIVQIFYLYQRPEIAWDFTKKREAIEHRNIPKEIFIRAFCAARNNVNSIKQEYGDKITLNLVIKNISHGLEKLELNIDSVDPYLNQSYTEADLRELLS